MMHGRKNIKSQQSLFEPTALTFKQSALSPYSVNVSLLIPSTQ